MLQCTPKRKLTTPRTGRQLALLDLITSQPFSLKDPSSPQRQLPNDLYSDPSEFYTSVDASCPYHGLRAEGIVESNLTIIYPSIH